jgi:hypothetical protein
MSVLVGAELHCGKTTHPTSLPQMPLTEKSFQNRHIVVRHRPLSGNA